MFTLITSLAFAASADPSGSASADLSGAAVDPTVAAAVDLVSTETGAAQVDADSESMEAQRHPRWRRPPPPPPLRRPPPPPPPRGPVTVARAPAEDLHDVTLTLSAVHLAVPMATVNAELRLHRQAGLVLTGGLGAYQGASLVEAGAELRGYAAGNFDRGLYLGLGGRYTSVPYYAPTDASAAATLVIGGKYTFAVPITIEGQIGPQVAMNDHGVSFGPAVKLNVGFSF